MFEVSLTPSGTGDRPKESEARMTTQQELLGTALGSVRALRSSLSKWVVAHWQLRDCARETVIADFERMLRELDTAWPLLTPIHGPALRVHRLLTKYLGTRFAPPGHPAGRDIVMPIPAGKVGRRFTEREEASLNMAFEFIETELAKLGGDNKPGAMVESKTDDGEYQSGQWFAVNTRVPPSRLRKAARRKSKNVRSRSENGVVCYSVEDATHWWEGDMPTSRESSRE